MERLGAAVRRKVSYAVLGAVMLVCCLTAWPLARAHLQAFAVMHEVAGEPVPRYARVLTVPVETRDSDFQIETRAGPQQVRARLLE